MISRQRGSEHIDQFTELRNKWANIMYIRFVVGHLDEDSGRRQGLFQAAASLRRRGRLLPHEQEQLEGLVAWFTDNLERPKSFSRSRKPHAANRALSWFKDTAALHITKMYKAAAVLEAHGVVVEVVKATRPGYVVYEDDYQITAEPYSDTET